MKEFDLIPSNYRTMIEKLQMLKIFSIGIAVFVLMSGISFAAIQKAKSNASIEIEKLTRVKEFTSMQRETLTLLENEKIELDNKWKLLKGLRQTTAPEELFYAIDLSLRDLAVWFTNLEYERREQSSKEDNLVETGYFIIISPTDENDSYVIGTTLTVSGGAANHSTLSRFVKNLLKQPSVNDARVLETFTDKSRKQRHINFTLEIIVNQDSSLS